jgi:hypothetical protein
MPRRRLKLLSFATALVGCLGIAPRPSRAEQLKRTTVEAFERYVRSGEARGDQELAGGKIFLWIDALPQPSRNQTYAALKQGDIITRRYQACEAPDCSAISGGLIHDWIAIVFVPGISIPQAIAVLQDYDHDTEYYGPEVLKSKLLERSGDQFRVFLRLKQVHVVTVVLDSEYDIRYTQLDATHAYSRSYSTDIREVEEAGKAQEHDRPVGDDHGFLWRLYSYWRFYQADGGTYIQCDAISLTRNVPAGLGWVIRPFIENIPAESLRFTLEATRTALLSRLAISPGSSRRTEEFK